MATSNSTPNYGLSQYLGGDIISFLSNLNGDMSKIDTALKAAKDKADGSIPSTRTLAGLPLTADITLAQLIEAGLAAGDASGNANNALKLAGIDASKYPHTDFIDIQELTLLNGWVRNAGWASGKVRAIKFGRIFAVDIGAVFNGTANTAIANLPDGYNSGGLWNVSSDGAINIQGNSIVAMNSTLNNRQYVFIS